MGSSSSQGDSWRGAEQEGPVGSGFGLHVPEMPPLVVKEGGFAFPLCPSGWHGPEAVDAFMEPQVYHLLKAIDKANVAKSGGGSMNLELSDEFLHRAVTLV